MLVLFVGIQTDSVLSARLQIIRIFIKDDGRLVIEFKTHAKFRGTELYVCVCVSIINIKRFIHYYNYYFCYYIFIFTSLCILFF